MYSLSNIYETFLPQLLTYPNPDDPLNLTAAGVYKRDKTTFDNIVKSYIKNYCEIYV